MNDVLESDIVKESVQEAAENTGEIIKDNLEVFNDALNDPEVKEQVVNAIKNAGVVGDALLDASKEPINKFAENVAEEVPIIASAGLSGLMKVGSDFAAAIPGVGAVIDILKAANDGAKALKTSVEATTNIIDSGAELINKTKENFEEIKKELKEKKKLAGEISNRTTNSINEFTKPSNNLQNQGGGRSKTRRRLNKYKAKSKRVRFAF